jgi:hypothetical protein
MADIDISSKPPPSLPNDGDREQDDTMEPTRVKVIAQTMRSERD